MDKGKTVLLELEEALESYEMQHKVNQKCKCCGAMAEKVGGNDYQTLFQCSECKHYQLKDV